MGRWIEAKSLSFAYESGERLWAPVDLFFNDGWYGLVGENGAGKSTLLALLCGTLRPTTGSVRVAPSFASVAFVAQRNEMLEPAIEHFAHSYDRTAVRLRARLQLDSAQLEEWERCSPGERKRWQLGAALAEEPAILLLDEPTNYLDTQAMQLLFEALRSFRGIGIVVSHDRTVLEELTTHTLRLHARTLRMYAGSYGNAKTQWEEEEAQHLANYRSLGRAEDRARQQLAHAREERAQAQRNRSSAVRMKNRNDADARSAVRKGSVDAAEKTLGRAVAAKRANVERIAAERAEVRFEKSRGGSIRFEHDECPRPRLAQLLLPELLAGERVLARSVSLVLHRGDRVRIHGANGVGKSTLLRALYAAMNLPEERCFFLSQAPDASEDQSIIEQVMALNEQDRGRVFALAAYLGLAPERIQTSKQASPGEARKLRLAMAMSLRCWVLLLDEPTNHLDLPSIERLETALVSWPGTLVLVSHEEAFASRCTQHTWIIEQKVVRSTTATDSLE